MASHVRHRRSLDCCRQRYPGGLAPLDEPTIGSPALITGVGCMSVCYKEVGLSHVGTERVMLQNARRPPVSDGPLVHSLRPGFYFFFLTVFFFAAFFLAFFATFFFAAFFFAIAVYLHVTWTES